VKTNTIQKFLVNEKKTEEENEKKLGINELMDNWYLKNWIKNLNFLEIIC